MRTSHECMNVDCEYPGVFNENEQTPLVCPVCGGPIRHLPTIAIDNVKAITRVTIPVPPAGVVILNGRNGTGKSTAIEATQALLSGSGSLECKDNEQRGCIEAFGAKITVTKVTRRSGELTAVHLEDTLDLGDLVNPGIAKPESADARRIKALINVRKIKADPAMFYDLCGGEDGFNGVMLGTVLTSDLVDMAAKVKRQLEAYSRDEAEHAETAENEAAALKTATADVPLDAEDDADKLQASLETAIQDDAALKAKHEATTEATGKAEEARVQLEAAKITHKGIGLSKAIAQLEGANAAYDLAQEALTEARDHAELCKQAHTEAFNIHAAALQYENTVAQFEDIITKASYGKAPTDAELETAAAKVTAAREAVETGALVRQAKEKMQLVDGLKEKAVEHRQAEEVHRDHSHATDKILSEAVGEGDLWVENGRLYTNTERGKTLFADLSEGERWAKVLPIAAENVGNGGVVTLGQEAWEGLDPDNRKLVAATCNECGVVLLTAEASDGELTAETL